MADSGGEGVAGGAFHPLVVVAAMPQSLGCSVDSLSGSFVVGNSEVWLRPAKVQPSLVSTVAAVDIFLVLGGRLLGVVPVELLDEIGRVFEIAGGVPGAIGVVETSPLDSILDLVSMVSGVEDLLYFPLLLFLDDYGRWWRLVMSWDRFGAGCGFEEADVEDWVDLDSGRQV